jgi:very-short-patch-repair endonuclease
LQRGVRGDLSLLKYNPSLKFFSRILRSNQTDSEKALWSRIRRRKILGVQFFRQRPLGKYIVDFYAPAVKLVIELDGSPHFEPEGQERDNERDDFLKSQGLTVMRFNSREVLVELDAVVSEICRAVEEKLKC